MELSDTTTEENEFSSMIVLGKGTAENVKFEWVASTWSNCSEMCGGNGFQLRTANCLVKLHNTTQEVESNFCEDAGLELPLTIRKCGLAECPKWITTDWTPCEKSKCFTWNTGSRTKIYLQYYFFLINLF